MKIFTPMFFAASLLGLIGCAIVTKIPSDRDALETAVRQNDAIATHSLLKDKSFTATSMFPSDHDKYYNELEAYQLLEFAITGKAENNFGQFKSFDPAPEGVCRPGVVQAILDAKLAPRPTDLSNAASVPCADVTEVILGKMSDKDAAAGTALFLQSFKLKVQNEMIHPHDHRKAWNLVFTVLEKRADDSTKVDIAEARNMMDKPIEEIVQIRQPDTNSKCVDIKGLPFRIVQKIDDHHYELVAETHDPGAIHMILETKEAVFTSEGHPVGIRVEYGGSNPVQLKNGFEGRAGVYRECGIIPYENNVRGWPGMAFRRDINGH